MQQHTPGSDAAPDDTVYARFAKRDLDKMSWLAPLFNNRFGDLLNIELRHEQVFFILGDRVLENVGYSEKGKRFSESEYGKDIRSLEDLRKYGYFLVGHRYDAACMREALRRQKDGYYYSFFSNQCQDWADRLKRGVERVERERGIRPLDRRGVGAGKTDRPVLPTEPASVWMGLVALALGAGGVLAPEIAGVAFSTVMGIFFLVSGMSHVVYGFHAKDWTNMMSSALVALVSFAAGVLLLWNGEFARVTGALVIAASLGIQGLANVFLGLFSRPRANWIGKLFAGLIMLGGTALIASRWSFTDNRLLGRVVGISLLSGGLSTIWLSWKTRTMDEHQETAPDVGPAEGATA
jgi:uncharacterized membrane protein HdeD (DUF308 family)